VQPNCDMGSIPIGKSSFLKLHGSSPTENASPPGHDSSFNDCGELLRRLPNQEEAKVGVTSSGLGVCPPLVLKELNGRFSAILGSWALISLFSIGCNPAPSKPSNSLRSQVPVMGLCEEVPGTLGSKSGRKGLLGWGQCVTTSEAAASRLGPTSVPLYQKKPLNGDSHCVCIGCTLSRKGEPGRGGECGDDGGVPRRMTPFACCLGVPSQLPSAVTGVPAPLPSSFGAGSPGGGLWVN